MTPNIIHTMKHTVKARVLTMSTLQALEEVVALLLREGTLGEGEVVTAAMTGSGLECRHCQPRAPGPPSASGTGGLRQKV
jgi:hypothetical protein